MQESSEFRVMEYGRGQTCGHSSRQVSVEVVSAEDFGVVEGSVVEQPTCTFSLQFGIPYPMDVLKADIIYPIEVSAGW